MGYTHYWTKPKEELKSMQRFVDLSVDAKNICEVAKAHGINIRNGYGEDEMVFAEKHFAINGDAKAFSEDGRDLAHEGFVWSIEQNDSFCKTNYKPYDCVVTAILIRAKAIYGDSVSVYSDGSWENWEQGCKLYEEVFGEVAECPFNETVTA